MARLELAANPTLNDCSRTVRFIDCTRNLKKASRPHNFDACNSHFGALSYSHENKTANVGGVPQIRFGNEKDHDGFKRRTTSKNRSRPAQDGKAETDYASFRFGKAFQIRARTPFGPPSPSALNTSISSRRSVTAPVRTDLSHLAGCPSWRDC